MAIEHVVDCKTGDAVDQDYEGQLPVLPQDPGLARREEAITVLRWHASAHKHERSEAGDVARAVLILLGLDEGIA